MNDDNNVEYNADDDADEEPFKLNDDMHNYGKNLSVIKVKMSADDAKNLVVPDLQMAD